MAPSACPAAPHELLPALRLVFPLDGELPADAVDSAGVFVVRDAAGTVRGAAVVQAMTGALALAWPPRAETADLADSLAAAACGWLRARGVKVCQAFATPAETLSLAPLERHGFRRVTDLVSLRGELGADRPRPRLGFTPESPPFSDPFRATLLGTHEATLDCPELNGDRTPDELLAGFADPAPGTTWHLAREGGEPVGVVTLAPGGAGRDLELAYLGVVPGVRGRGLGSELLAFARAEAAGRGAAALTTSVDARNGPALKLYRRNGFVETDRRGVWLAHFIRQ
jgi:mycothiol synthase